ncbi:thioredoxin domain-containing protein [Anaerolineae bacterium]|nr:thioredoxin domain-containing protein [Anaerolineae bacterium]
MPNRLAQESSPYLQQHGSNPVDWFPWGAEALARALAEDKPIFLSIGYAACHWCHVMEHESFEDAATAEILNRNFVCIKVDREERSDLDSIYMQAVVAMTGHGGWPMSVWLNPQREPFYGGTYFPPERRHGMPGFKELLRNLAEAWQQRRGELQENARAMLEHLRSPAAAGGAAGALPDAGLLPQALQAVLQSFDWSNGGWGAAPKFPQPMTIEFLLRQHARSADPLALEMAERTLQAMAAGGMYDQLGGGFHRYAVDDHWLVPHFEKMLYDNAQLARVYLHAFQVTGKPLYKRIVEETCDYLLREMTEPGGGFYSAQDADSEGEEGRFFVWSVAEVREILKADALLFMEAFDVTAGGNFEGHSILHVQVPLALLAEKYKLAEDEVESRLARARMQLWAVREQRIKPLRDEKVLTAWNGLALAALAEAARVLGRADYLLAAQRNAEFVLGTLHTANGRLLRTWRAGSPAKLNAYLEDYANYADGLLELYQATFEERWFVAARQLADAMLEHFADDSGGFFDTSADHEQLITRPKDLQDNAVPGGNGMAAGVLLRLAAYTADARYSSAAEQVLARVQASAARYPTAFAQTLQALDFYASAPAEVALVGPLQDSGMAELLAELREPYRPHQVLALLQPLAGSAIPLLHGRVQLGGQATAYVCRNFACQLPVTTRAALHRQAGSPGQSR